MIMTLKTADYLTKVIAAIESGTGTIPLTDTCPECGWSICTWDDATRDDGHLVMQVTSDVYAVLVGCEGYWITDPDLVGLPRNGWMSADAEIVVVEDHPVCVLDVPKS